MISGICPVPIHSLKLILYLPYTVVLMLRISCTQTSTNNHRGSGSTLGKI